MSMTPEQEMYLADFQADLDHAISEHDWKKCTEIIFKVKDAGYDQEARIMTASFSRAKVAWEETSEKIARIHGDFIAGVEENGDNALDMRDYLDRRGY